MHVVIIIIYNDEQLESIWKKLQPSSTSLGMCQRDWKVFRKILIILRGGATSKVPLFFQTSQKKNKKNVKKILCSIQNVRNFARNVMWWLKFVSFILCENSKISVQHIICSYVYTSSRFTLNLEYIYATFLKD